MHIFIYSQLLNFLTFCTFFTSSVILTEGYAAGHCPYLDQCVFTHMDAQDVLAWLKVEYLRLESIFTFPLLLRRTSTGTT